MDIFSKKATPYKCPDCGKPLTPEPMAGFKGMVSQSMWDSIYSGIFLVRRPRYVCTNPNCKSNFEKSNHKFVKNLLGIKMVDEHFLDDAMRKSRKK